MRSAEGKREEVNRLLRSSQPHVAILTETKLSEHWDADGYKGYGSFPSKQAGVSVQVREDLEAERLFTYKHYIVVVRVKVSDSMRVVVVGAYVPSNGKAVFAEWEAATTNLFKAFRFPKAIIGGDFNKFYGQALNHLKKFKFNIYQPEFTRRKKRRDNTWSRSRLDHLAVFGFKSASY